MSYVKKEEVINAINSQIFMKPATKERLRKVVNDLTAADVVRDIFTEIESCIEYSNMAKVKVCAFARANKCSALTNKFCKECSFFKTAEELKKRREQTEKRITSLPRLVQLEIRSKYYSKKVAAGE